MRPRGTGTAVVIATLAGLAACRSVSPETEARRVSMAQAVEAALDAR